MKKIILIISLLLQSIDFFANPIYYTPRTDDNGFLNIADLNQAIQTTSLNVNEGSTTNNKYIDFIIPEGTYLIKNTDAIILKNNINLKGNNVTFKYKYIDLTYQNNMVIMQGVYRAGITGIIFDLREAYQFKKPSFSNASNFENRSVIFIKSSDSCVIKNCKIYKILGSGIELSNTKNCWINANIIDGSWIYGAGNGTQGYGINITGANTKNNVISNNTINDTRHNIVLQYNCNNNIIDNNTLQSARTLHKFIIWECFKVASNLTFHGNGPYSNTASNNTCNWLAIDNIKDNGNGPGNIIIGNNVNELDVQSVAPDFTYNQGQIIKNNKYTKMKIEPKNCVDSGNIKR